ncbi:MAG TPA: dihydropteroate synthase, partial [Longimicrobiales bacterium]|nr:dihydropteroate synthase [Longimicrobiales bacterium]
IINDVSGFRLDAGMARVAAETGAGVVLMHSRGTVEDMASYDTAAYQRDPVATIVAELSDALDLAVGAGVETGRIVLDPGLGFSKRTEHSAAILQELDRVLALGRPVLVGPSRKRFLAELAGGVPVDARLPGTLAACVTALLAGARIFRVHDVAAARQALDVAEALAPRAGGV